PGSCAAPRCPGSAGRPATSTSSAPPTAIRRAAPTGSSTRAWPRRPAATCCATCAAPGAPMASPAWPRCSPGRARAWACTATWWWPPPRRGRRRHGSSAATRSTACPCATCRWARAAAWRRWRCPAWTTAPVRPTPPPPAAPTARTGPRSCSCARRPSSTGSRRHRRSTVRPRRRRRPRAACTAWWDQACRAARRTPRPARARGRTAAAEQGGSPRAATIGENVRFPRRTQAMPESRPAARILDGRRIADELLESLRQRVAARVASGRPPPGLAVVLVGDNPASRSYVRNKRRAAGIVGIRAFDHDLPEGTSEAELLALIDRLNADPAVHGILVQLPLPGIPDATRLIHRIDPRKDVDGFHPENVGHLALRQFGLRPC